MRKSIILVFGVLATCTLAAFGYWSRIHTTTNPDTSSRAPVVSAEDLENPGRRKAVSDLGYNVASRFAATITKEELFKARSVADIVPKEAQWSKIPFQTVTLSMLGENSEESIVEEGKTLSADQLKMLHAAPYSADFHIKARGEEIHESTGRIEDYVYYLTIIPESEASYPGGTDALVAYFEESKLEEKHALYDDVLKSGRILFTVTKEGTITNAKLTSTSGYPAVDTELLEQVEKMPGKWSPATNAKGEKVEQTLVLFFGQQGC